MTHLAPILPSNHVTKCHISMFLNISRAVTPPLFWCLMTLLEKKYFLISNLNIPRRNLRPFPLILLLVTQGNNLRSCPSHIDNGVWAHQLHCLRNEARKEHEVGAGSDVAVVLSKQLHVWAHWFPSGLQLLSASLRWRGRLPCKLEASGNAT